LDKSGGIGRLMSYVMDNLQAASIVIRHVDTRGNNTRPIFSVAPLLAAMSKIVLLKVTGRVDLVHINISYRGSTIRKCTIAGLCYLIRIPTVLHLHTCEYEDFFRRLPAPLKYTVRKIFQRADHVIVLGRVWERFVVHTLGVSETHVTVLYNAAPGRRPLSGPCKRSGGDVRLLFLGRLGARKGAPDLLQALAGLQSDLGWSITMAGDGDIAGSRKRAQELGLLDRVTFTGWLDAEQVDDLLESSDVLVLPSYAEGLPMSVIEAFAHGVAVIATPVGAIPEIVIDGESGLLVPAGDTGALCDVIQTLCVDADMRQKLARAGRKMWEKDLDITEYAVRLSTIWRTVAAHPAVSASAAG